MSLTCILVGDESLLVQCAGILGRDGHELRGIITSSSAVREWAKQEAVACIEPGLELAERLREIPCDVLFSIANVHVLPAEVIRHPRIAAVNFHDGPLPERAGLNVPTWAIHDGEKEHGITWHLMTDSVDRGDIIAERRFPIEPDETVLSLNLKCYEAAIESFPEVLDRLSESPLKKRPQQGQGMVHRRSQRPPLAGILDWTESAERLSARVRSLDFGPYANPITTPKLLTPKGGLMVVRTAKVERSSRGEPGTILTADADELVVATSDGSLRLGGISDLDGNPVDLGTHGLVDGIVLPFLSNDVTERLDALTKGLAPNESFWRQMVAGYQPTKTPYEKPSSENGLDRRSSMVDQPEEMKAFVARLCGPETECTPEDAFVLAFSLYLARLCGTKTIEVGLRSASVADALKGLPAMFVRTLPLKIELEDLESSSEAVYAAAEALREVHRRGTYPRDLVMRSPEVSTLPDHAIVLDLAGDEANAPLVVRLLLDGSVEWAYDPSTFDESVIELMQSQFEMTVAHLATNLEGALSEIDILGKHEREEILYRWNDTAVEGDLDVCIHELIERRVQEQPNRTAVHFGEESWSYAELNARANQIAHALRVAGVRTGAYVGVYLERSATMLASLLAVMKTGAAYVPLDPEFPSNRLDFMCEDAGLAVIIAETEHSVAWLNSSIPVLPLDTLDSVALSSENLEDGPQPDDLAYVLYTSGSTGKPKGVMVEHRNVVNFFLGMDESIAAEQPGVWLAVTSISFDISVLELFWTLARGFTVVIQQDEQTVASAQPGSSSPIAFSLFYFASDEGGESAADKYKLLLDGARFGDAHGFEAVWTPERHFHAFGGLYPNPSVASAALATITSNIGLRAGSCVSPLHHPARIAEEWGVVDVLSNGRVGISFAAGWQPNDFVLRPEAFAERKEHMFGQIEQVKALWRGETLEFDGPTCEPVNVQTLPRPVQAELPVWITAAGNPETFHEAGARGYHVLTHLLGQRVEDLAEKIEIYRQARHSHGHVGEDGRVTLMLHTFVGDDDDAVRELVREPMKAYLKSSIGLIQAAAWSFPTFRQKTTGEDGKFSVEHLAEDALDEVLDFSFERYFETSALFGTPDTCRKMVERLKQIGVNEIACLVDYGVETQAVLDMLPQLSLLKDQSNAVRENVKSIPENIRAYAVTHLQCTPTQASLLVADPDTVRALGALDHLLIGGEALSGKLVRTLNDADVERITNMYGPTETTIWSATHDASLGEDVTVPLGRPIANTRFYVLDGDMQPVPVGVSGELWIGGMGVARGYHNRPELTKERFAPDPFVEGERIYQTGDLVRYRTDGVLEFLGRTDCQVKLRGFRIELGEIEAALSNHPEVREAVVVVREDSPGDQRLVGYFRSTNGLVPDWEQLRSFLGDQLPEYMVPGAFVALDSFPMTPNRKLDRKALPPPSRAIVVAPSAASFKGTSHSAMEKELVAIWEDVLGVHGVDPQSNFFDLGGHSLLAMQVQARIRNEQNLDVRIVDLFRFPTVRTLAEHLRGSGEEETETVSKGADRGARRAAFLGKRARP